MFHHVLKFTPFFFALGILALVCAPRVYAADYFVLNCANDQELRAHLAAIQSSGGGTLAFECSSTALVVTGVLPTITTNTIINGANQVNLSGNNTTRLFRVESGASLTLQDISLTGGYSSDDGGAIVNHGSLYLKRATLYENHTSQNDGSGGAIVSYGVLDIQDSKFMYNKGANGGALYLRWSNSVTTIRNTQFLGNETTSTQPIDPSTSRPIYGWGGAILLWDGAQMTIQDNSTLTANVAHYGGAIYVQGTNSKLTIKDSTLAQNLVDQKEPGRSPFIGGGAIHNAGTTHLINTIVKENFGRGGGGIYSTGTLTMHGGSLRDNEADIGGGGLDSDGMATLTDVLVTGNKAGYGGGLSAEGMMTLTDVSITHNEAYAYGGIEIMGTVTLTDVTISHNSAEFFGGGMGLYTQDEAVKLVNVTISHNSAQDTGGGIAIGCCTTNPTLKNVTVANNTAPNTSGIWTTVTINLENTIIANTAGSNCRYEQIPFEPLTPPTSNGYNLSSDTTCAGWFTQATDLNNVNPLLGPLADNGGTTQTHLPQAGSPALNKIPNGTNGCGTTLTTDQRGITRPQGSKCDIGAVEVVVNPPTPTRTATTPSQTNTPTRTATTPAQTNTPTRTATASAQTNTPTATVASGGKPAKPPLVAPANNSTTTKKRVALRWDQVAGAVGYHVVVTQDSRQGTVVDSADTTGKKYKTIMLTKGKTYFWYVQACNAAAQCSKSAVWKFKVQ